MVDGLAACHALVAIVRLIWAVALSMDAASGTGVPAP
jgi:hypothetical protein